MAKALDIFKAHSSSTGAIYQLPGYINWQTRSFASAALAAGVSVKTVGCLFIGPGSDHALAALVTKSLTTN